MTALLGSASVSFFLYLHQIGFYSRTCTNRGLFENLRREGHEFHSCQFQAQTIAAALAAEGCLLEATKHAVRPKPDLRTRPVRHD